MKKRKKKSNVRKYCLLVVLLGLLTFNFSFKMTLKGNKTEKVNVNEKYIDAGVVASIFGQPINVEVSSNVNSKKVGTYEIEYTAKCLFVTKKIKRIVNVIDDVSPEITFKREISNVCPNNIDTKNYTAMDNLDGDITKNVKVKKEGEYLIYSVKDSSNNYTEVKKKVTFIDNEKPNITLKGEKIITVKKGEKYTESGYVATDNCDGDITKNVIVNGKVNTDVNGEYKLTYSVKDSNNNTFSITRTIVVGDTDTESAYPNINGYKEVIEGPTYIKGILIVNKIYTLPSDYNPGVNKEAYAALNALQADATNNGYSMGLISGFRSYTTQKRIYERNVASKGYNNSDFASARPGHSEHQSGLAFDVGQLKYTFGDTPAGKWLAANCHKYGFIIRYPKGKTDITGYNYEPWHIRYLGVDLATEIYNKGITLEEYLGVNGVSK